jgi:hypothetical protein
LVQILILFQMIPRYGAGICHACTNICMVLKLLAFYIKKLPDTTI